MRYIVPLLATLPGAALACSPCRAQVQAQVFGDGFGTIFLLTIAPVAAVVLGAMLIEVFRDDA